MKFRVHFSLELTGWTDVEADDEHAAEELVLDRNDLVAVAVAQDDGGADVTITETEIIDKEMREFIAGEG